MPHSAAMKGQPSMLSIGSDADLDSADRIKRHARCGPLSHP